MSSVENLGALERRFDASIPQQQIRGEIEARLKRLGRTAKVHGFRPGKVPYKILEQQYGAQVHQEVLGDALQRSFAEVARSNSLNVAGHPNFDVKTFDPAAEHVEYSATFEVYPEIVFGDIGAESVERATYTLTDADIDNTIATLRKQRTEYEVTDRAAQNDDQVRIDFRGTLDGVVFEGGEAKNYAVVLGVGRTLPDFEKAIIGMKAGESKTFDMTFPDDYHGKDVAGKQVTFTIALHAVEAPHQPELDAEFAKLLGVQDGNIDTLKAEIRDNMQREVERRLKVRNKDNAMDTLLKISQLEVPKALLSWEVQSMMKQAIKDMEERGMKIPKDMTLPADIFTERAERRVKLGLILAELVKQHGFGAQAEQVKAVLEDYAQSFEQPEEVVKWYYADPSRLQEWKNLVLEDNVVAWVMEKARVTDKAMEFNELMGKN